MSNSTSLDFSRSLFVLRHGNVWVITKAEKLNQKLIKIDKNLKKNWVNLLWPLTSQLPPKYPQTSVFVKWQWKSNRSRDDVEILTRNGWIFPRLEKGTDSISVFPSLMVDWSKEKIN